MSAPVAGSLLVGGWAWAVVKVSKVSSASPALRRIPVICFIILGERLPPLGVGRESMAVWRAPVLATSV
ncbi:hypothetical protein D9M71_805250 [compost metagenome]